MSATKPWGRIPLSYAPDRQGRRSILESCLRLVMGGMIAWMCIDGSLRSAVERGFEVILVPEIIASRALTWRDISLDAEQRLAAALAPLAFFSRMATVAEAEALLAQDRN